MSECWVLLIFYEQELLVTRCFTTKERAFAYFRSYMETQFDELEDFGYEKGDAADTFEKDLAWTGRTESESRQIEATLMQREFDIPFENDAETMTQEQENCFSFAHFGQFCSNRF